MSILLLSNQQDAVATALYNRLLADKQPVRHVLAEELAYARSWKQSIDQNGKTDSIIVLQDGFVIDSRKIRRVFNRIRYLPMVHFIKEIDRTYAEMEMYALFMSFLKSLNRLMPDPLLTRNLSLDDSNMFFYNSLAIQARLPILDFHYTSSPRWQYTNGLIPVNAVKRPASGYKKSAHLVWENQPTLFISPFKDIIKILVVGEEIVMPATVKKFKNAFRKFADLAGLHFFEAYMAETEKGYRLIDVNTFPPYADDETIEKLSQFLLPPKKLKN